MNNKKYQVILSIITGTVMATLLVQGYWNYQNYKSNKQEFINQVQLTLDNVVEAYYSNLAKHDVFRMIASGDSVNFHGMRYQSFSSSHHYDSLPIIKMDSSISTSINIIKRDTTISFDSHTRNLNSTLAFKKGVFNGDSLPHINELASKIMISISSDTLDFSKLRTLLDSSFYSKSWDLDYGLAYFDHDCSGTLFMPCDSLKTNGTEALPSNYLSASATSVFLPQNTQLEIRFSNITSILFRRSMVGILLSLVLTIGTIGCLLFLLKVIRDQKELVAMKDDLIGNITHEFKTPITTVASALEAIENFNSDNNPEKTKNYLDLSNQQLIKLNNMVEKLLETAALDSSDLELNKEPVDLIALITEVVNRFKLIAPDRNFKLHQMPETVELKVDKFHFENALSNLIDNAVKYGGVNIDIKLRLEDKVIIEVIDDGEGIEPKLQKRIFEKFYRIPTGNRHDVKGFGIGLYYTKNIIEKHVGKIDLSSKKGITAFTLTFENGV